MIKEGAARSTTAHDLMMEFAHATGLVGKKHNSATCGRMPLPSAPSWSFIGRQGKRTTKILPCVSWIRCIIRWDAIVRTTLEQPLNFRLAFRELGLAIGLEAVGRLERALNEHPGDFSSLDALRARVGELMAYVSFGEAIEAF